MKKNLLLFLLLTGCASTSTTIIRHEVTLEEIRAVCFHADQHDSVGCATVGSTCNVYIPKKSEYPRIRAAYPKLQNIADIAIELHILGHEVKHCLDGQWH